MYLCGPTVYKAPHIGHMVGPVVFDAVKKYLTYRGYQVTWIVNITDVEDKLIEAAIKLNTSVDALAGKYTREYFDVLKSLGITTIDHFPKASEHMPEIIGICQKLIDRGYAYAAEGNVYFDVTKDSDYGKLSHRKVEEQESGMRVLEGGGKRNPADFALWKAAKPGEPVWDAPWGKGRPGWHIECSAMSQKYLGETLDIHGGGMDLIFPHHENEIAQSESASGKPLANFWMHNGLTKIKTKLASGEWKDEKMSGSIGNVVSARELIAEHGADLMRYFLLATHYRSPIEFTGEAIGNAKKAIGVFARLFERVERIVDGTASGPGALKNPGGKESGPPQVTKIDEIQTPAFLAPLKQKFLDSMDDDFNTGAAIGTLHEMAGAINSFITSQNVEATKSPADVEAVVAAAETLRTLGQQILGIFNESAKPASSGEEAELLEKTMQLLIQLRQEARQQKNFALADSIRKGLEKIGITLEDRPGGTIWRKA